jgi:hypothetical protein
MGTKEWLLGHPALLIALGGFSVVAFFGTLAAIPILVIRLPEDYFLEPRRRPGEGRRPLVRWTVRLVKNAAGAVFLLAGLAMLVLPGQGLLTIFIALTLLDFPGKRRAEARLMHTPRIRRAVDALRNRAGRPPLQFPEEPRGAHNGLREEGREDV